MYDVVPGWGMFINVAQRNVKLALLITTPQTAH
jgi:hypothetical protein